jgi:hypothetical protein
MLKFIILTDSIGNPRSFPVTELTELEETYPYLLRSYFKEAIFWQLSYGNVSSEQLIRQAGAYLTHWNPDYIIVQSGIIDSRPEAFSEFQKTVMNKMSGPLARRLRKTFYNPSWIKKRQISRTSKASFKKTAKKLRLLFDDAKIFWLEICAADAYERARPGVQRRIIKYNQILEGIYGERLIPVKEKLLEVEGFNADNLHWNKRGHEVVSKILINRICENENEGKRKKSDLHHRRDGLLA